MNNARSQPSKFNAMLGGQIPPPIDGLVLDGIEGAKHCLKNVNTKEQAHVLIDALRYGNEGLNLFDGSDRTISNSQSCSA